MKNESLGFWTILNAMIAQLGETTAWINDNITLISGYLAIAGSIAWIISSFYRAKADKVNTQKTELEIKKLMGERATFATGDPE